MTWELVHTSAPRGIDHGSQGFTTVMLTHGLEGTWRQRLEALSSYTVDSRLSPGPVIHRHAVVRIGGARRHVLSRIGPCGLDYSGRDNRIAHHILLETSECNQTGPAWLLQQDGLLRNQWDGDPTANADGPILPEGHSPPAPCRYWAEVSGDAGNAAHLLRHFRDKQARTLQLAVPAGTDTLRLFSEAIALLSPSERWQATFTTVTQQIVSDAICLWQAVIILDGVPIEPRPSGNFDIRDMPRCPEDAYTTAAREGLSVAPIRMQRSTVIVPQAIDPLDLDPETPVESPVEATVPEIVQLQTHAEAIVPTGHVEAFNAECYLGPEELPCVAPKKSSLWVWLTSGAAALVLVLVLIGFVFSSDPQSGLTAANSNDSQANMSTTPSVDSVATNTFGSAGVAEAAGTHHEVGASSTTSNANRSQSMHGQTNSSGGSGKGKGRSLTALDTTSTNNSGDLTNNSGQTGLKPKQTNTTATPDDNFATTPRQSDGTTLAKLEPGKLIARTGPWKAGEQYKVHFEGEQGADEPWEFLLNDKPVGPRDNTAADQEFRPPRYGKLTIKRGPAQLQRVVLPEWLTVQLYSESIKGYPFNIEHWSGRERELTREDVHDLHILIKPVVVDANEWPREVAYEFSSDGLTLSWGVGDTIKIFDFGNGEPLLVRPDWISDLNHTAIVMVQTNGEVWHTLISPELDQCDQRCSGDNLAECDQLPARTECERGNRYDEKYLLKADELKDLTRKPLRPDSDWEQRSDNIWGEHRRTILLEEKGWIIDSWYPRVELVDQDGRVCLIWTPQKKKTKTKRKKVNSKLPL